MKKTDRLWSTAAIVTLGIGLTPQAAVVASEITTPIRKPPQVESIELRVLKMEFEAKPYYKPDMDLDTGFLPHQIRIEYSGPKIISAELELMGMWFRIGAKSIAYNPIEGTGTIVFKFDYKKDAKLKVVLDAVILTSQRELRFPYEKLVKGEQIAKYFTVEEVGQDLDRNKNYDDAQRHCEPKQTHYKLSLSTDTPIYVEDFKIEGVKDKRTLPHTIYTSQDSGSPTKISACFYEKPDEVLFIFRDTKTIRLGPYTLGNTITFSPEYQSPANLIHSVKPA